MMQGGEIFVPKIPSMRVPDMARAMAPDLEHEIIGIRPGEKLHEVLIPEDDARNTIELDDRFIVEPEFAFWSRETYTNNGGRPVTQDFRYASDNNSEWLDAAGLKKLMKLAET